MNSPLPPVASIQAGPELFRTLVDVWAPVALLVLVWLGVKLWRRRVHDSPRGHGSLRGGVIRKENLVQDVRRVTADTSLVVAHFGKSDLLLAVGPAGAQLLARVPSEGALAGREVSPVHKEVAADLTGEGKRVQERYVRSRFDA